MKRTLFIAFLLTSTLVQSCVFATEPTISFEDNVITVSDAPDNSTLISVFYEGDRLSGVKMQTGSGTITEKVSAEDGDEFKVFLWDMESIRPLCDSQSIKNTANEIYITVNDAILTAELEDNSSAEAFYELLKAGDITVEMSDYGNFEKVGPLGVSLPRSDEDITTEAGHVILYQGDKITIYYDTNTWNFTRLARIKNISQSELKKILGEGDVSVTFSVKEPNNVAAFDLKSGENGKAPKVTLNSGYEMPVAGIGTYSLHEQTCVDAVKSALEQGVRLIDTAAAYDNEEEVGQAVREFMEESGVGREEIFVITKLYPGEDFSNPEAAIDKALEKLDIGYIDMMLLHHPGENDVKAYKAIEQYIAEGKIHTAGLSNWYIEEIDDFISQVNIKPDLVQNEIHPYYQEQKVVPYMHNLGIAVQAWYPLGGRGHTSELLNNETIVEIANAHGKSAAQVILRWDLQNGVIVIPGSSNPEHIKENISLFDFELSDEEMDKIAALDRNEKHDWY